MTTTNKDFKVKNGIVVSGDGTFGGPVTVGDPTEPSHAVTKEYLDSAIALLANIDGGTFESEFLSGGSPETTIWSGTFDGGTL